MLKRIIPFIVPGALALTMLTVEAPESEITEAIPVSIFADSGSAVLITQAPPGERRRVRRRTRRRVKRRHEKREEMKPGFMSISSSTEMNYYWTPCLA